ncbi:RagB/SusD family nutrient uptake outer membrane protein [Chitinophaga sp. S165]|uniref:RagB/SusD family nutrient uptake outer membrane protein n=1 Tax=Chitinophaga sp. S165 TaxID=2135462 RepID=UPI000D711B21|nr:RagB/SusD family nutrient uptake outer membrane protein [Chitinophaga sp. S165]PWV47066.1 RagB/SusD domain-containing protein [Chitinophaga sp. S165]
MKRIFFCVFILLFLQLCYSCKKFLTVKVPENRLTNPMVFANDSTATAALVGIYAAMSSQRLNFPSGDQSITLLTGLNADELDNYSGMSEIKEFYANDISPTNTINWNIWRQLYVSIYQCNSVLEGLNTSSMITPLLKQQLLGEALFLRAFFYFYLVNLYGQVPLALTTSYQVNNVLSRSPIPNVYCQIKNDLISARTLLSDEYISGTERIRANRYAASALLARVYLYCHQWEQTVVNASLVINCTNKYHLCDQLTDVFLKNSPEVILQLQPSLPKYNTFDAEIFILNTVPTLVACSRQLQTAFEPTDKRQAAWMGSVKILDDRFYFPYKYKVQVGADVQEYLMLLRLGELYLVRAEAYAHLGLIDSALADLNIIRERASTPPFDAISVDSILNAIYMERQVELFSEWGHRWFDLKRTLRADEVLNDLKFPGWNTLDTLYPIPQSEIALNPHLTQNVGY